jgi:hypothetical protein
MHRVFFALTIFVLLLSGCGTFEVYVEKTPVGESVIPGSASTPEPKLSLDSTSEEIQRAMLESATKWKSIWLDGTVTNYGLDGTDSQTTTHEQVWIDLTTNRFRVLTGPADGAAEQFLTSDGATILKIDLKTGQSQSDPLPDFAQVGQFVPTPQPGNAYPQPLWGQIGTPLSELAFTSDFAQNEGTFKPVGTELIADREALVVEWTYAQSDVPSWRMWLDGKTAVILKMQSYDKGGGNTVRSEAVVDQVSFDDVFGSSLFGIPSSMPQFSDITGQGSTSTETGADIPAGSDALGEIYFFALPRLSSNETTRLLRVPASCAVGLAECPQVETIEPPFAWKFTLPHFVWSPDGKLAAFSYSDDPQGSPSKLWLFNPAANTWTSLWEYTYIDLPMWSPDGQWISFREQDGLGGETIMVIHPDGSEPKDLTAGGNLSAVSLPYVIDGWISGNLIVRSGKYGTNDTVYLIRVADAHVQPMFKTSLTKAMLVPSSDSAWIAFDDLDISTMIHSVKVAEPDGANAVELANFTGGSIYPIVWSPDNRQLAFAYYTEATQGEETADVYIIGRDGKGLKQIYKGVHIGDVLFSPNGKYLLINETSSAIGGRLFIVNLDTLEQGLLQSPSLTLDSDWFNPAWR